MSEPFEALDTPFRTIEGASPMYESEPTKNDEPELMVATSQGSELVGTLKGADHQRPPSLTTKPGTWAGGILGPGSMNFREFLQ